MPKSLNTTSPSVFGKGKPPKALRLSDGWSGLWGDDTIEFIDITDSPLRKYLSPFRELVLDPKDTEVDAGGKVVIIL